MLFRFSLYGFLKNQRYFEPFFALALLERGLSFAQIGVLIGVREACLNVLEVPSGAAADAYGRRRCMVLSFVAYIASFLTLAWGTSFWHYVPAMVAYGVGDAFRTGTHKAMIFEWLRQHGREHERTRVYGYTRSWSKIGSAVSSLLAGGFVLLQGRYADIFLAAVVPYAINLVNLATYPRTLDGTLSGPFRPGAVWRRTWQTARDVARSGPLRGLMIESMGFEGTYKTVKDYLQPVLVALAVGLPIFVELEAQQRSAVVVAMTYALLFALSSVASRQAHRFEARSGGIEPAAARLWWGAGASFLVLLGCVLFELPGFAAAGFVVLAMLQNLWRPLLVSRIDEQAEAESGATVMSVEAQAQSLATMVFAPLVGWLVDAQAARLGSDSVVAYWPVAVFGLVAVVLVGGLGRRPPVRADAESVPPKPVS